MATIQKCYRIVYSSGLSNLKTWYIESTSDKTTWMWREMPPPIFVNLEIWSYFDDLDNEIINFVNHFIISGNIYIIYFYTKTAAQDLDDLTLLVVFIYGILNVTVNTCYVFMFDICIFVENCNCQVIDITNNNCCKSNLVSKNMRIIGKTKGQIKKNSSKN